MEGVDIIKLAADLAVGTITADAISELYGDGILGAVLAITGGGIAGTLTNSALNAIDRETGIVSDLGSLVDDIFSIF